VPLQRRNRWWRSRSLWREAEGFVFCVDPDADYFCFLAFFGVVGAGHRRERADGYADLDAGAGTVRGAAFHDFVAFDRAVVAGGAPVGDEVLHLVAWAGLPEFVGAGHVAGDDKVEELLRGFLLRIKTERIPESHDDDDSDRRDGKSHGA